jgi:threonine dehydratase
MLLPTLDDINAAGERVYRTLRRTPLIRHPLLCLETGLEIYVKHENHLPTGSFKIRGGLNLIPTLSAEERRGVLAATTGNHGQSIALACQRGGVPCTILVPKGNNPDKNAAMRAFGANVIEFGRDYDEARERVEAMHKETGLRYIHSANEPMLIAGVATYALEIFDNLPDADVILVPIGGGTGACGCAIVRSALGRTTKIIGVQTERADVFARSWHGGVRVTGTKADTFADGMATRVTFDLTFGILATELDDVVTLSEAELAEGVRLALRTTHNLAEGAGAAALMAAKKMCHGLQGKKVVSVMTGGNIDGETLRKILQGLPLSA